MVKEVSSFAGVSGLRGVWCKDTAVMMDMRVSPSVGLPFAVMMAGDDGQAIQQPTPVAFHP